MNWVFGYGSLMWRPDFVPLERRLARLEGYSRAFCRLSFRHRGTPENPGMVVGLVPGGNCQGFAFQLPPGEEHAIMAMLDEREGAGYRREILPVHTAISATTTEGTVAVQTTESVQAHIYIPDSDHPSHAPSLPRDEMIRLIANGVGVSGSARDYLEELTLMLARLNVREPELEKMLAAVDRLRSNA